MTGKPVNLATALASFDEIYSPRIVAHVNEDTVFAAANRHGVPIDSKAFTTNHKRMDKESPITVHSINPIKNKFRIVRDDDSAHNSVVFRADVGKRKHNNPPAKVAVVSDSGRLMRKFKQA